VLVAQESIFIILGLYHFPFNASFDCKHVLFSICCCRHLCSITISSRPPVRSHQLKSRTTGPSILVVYASTFIAIIWGLYACPPRYCASLPTSDSSLFGIFSAPRSLLVSCFFTIYQASLSHPNHHPYQYIVDIQISSFIVSSFVVEQCFSLLFICNVPQKHKKSLHIFFFCASFFVTHLFIDFN